MCEINDTEEVDWAACVDDVDDDWVQLDYGLWPLLSDRQKWGPRGTRQPSEFLAPTYGVSGNAAIVFEHSAR